MKDYIFTIKNRTVDKQPILKKKIFEKIKTAFMIAIAILIWEAIAILGVIQYLQIKGN